MPHKSNGRMLAGVLILTVLLHSLLVLYSAQLSALQGPQQPSDLRTEPPYSATDNFSDTSVAVCTILQNEGPYIREWLKHHLGLGVSKVYLFDHNSSEPLIPLIEDYLAAGTTKYHHFIDFYLDEHIRKSRRTNTPPQHYVYQQCLELYGHKHRWMAFIDVDEFIILQGEALGFNLPEFLEAFEPYGALMMNWKVFGSSGHEAPPAAGVRVSYTQCLPAESDPEALQGISLHTKPIVQPRYVKQVQVHEIVQDPDIAAQHPLVHDDFTPAERHSDWWKSKSWHGSRLVLHHYIVKSRQEAAEKRKTAAELAQEGRWKATGGARGMEWVDKLNSLATETCKDALIYVT